MASNEDWNEQIHQAKKRAHMNLSTNTLTSHPARVAMREREEIEKLKTKRICTHVFGEQSADGSIDFAGTGLAPECAVLESALYAIKVDVPKGSPQRVVIQDLAASLSRKGFLLQDGAIEKFWEYAEDKISDVPF
ncbi:Uncharacterised protein [uncultured archaeon]|nr:Uncharacterised protein [uncultured archaeon]